MSPLEPARGEPVHEKEGGARWFRVLLKEVYLLARDFLVAVFFFAFVVYFLFQPFKVEGTSMTPGLQPEERILVNKISYRFEPVHRGDIVVFEFPEDVSKSYIKRVVGLPGERVAIRDGCVYINGNKLEEPYVSGEHRGHDTMEELRVKRGHYFVLGDSRTRSADSRVWGLIPSKYIFGKAAVCYWPFDEVRKIH
jgi:signal peptidase I